MFFPIRVLFSPGGPTHLTHRLLFGFGLLIQIAFAADHPIGIGDQRLIAVPAMEVDEIVALS